LSYDTAGVPPSDGQALRAWLLGELKKISLESLEPSVLSIRFKQRPQAPERVYDGLTVMADGANWNPGGGQGVYTYYAGAWNRLG
jgi:hypothetical protein